MLRAEKGYPIVGQDTDGTVTPQDLGHGLGRVEEEGRLRRQALAAPAPTPHAPDRKQLVGLLPDDPAALLPEGAQLVARRRLPSRRCRCSATYLQLPQRRARPDLRARAARRRGGAHGRTVYAPLAEGTIRRDRHRARPYDPEGARATAEYARQAWAAGRAAPVGARSSLNWAACGSGRRALAFPAQVLARTRQARRSPDGARLPAARDAEHGDRATAVALRSGSGPTSGSSSARRGTERALVGELCEERSRPRTGRAGRTCGEPHGARAGGPDARASVLAERAARSTCTRAAFGPGRTARRTRRRARGAQVILWQPDGRSSLVYRILVRCSFAAYLAEWLVDAMAEYQAESAVD